MCTVIHQLVLAAQTETHTVLPVLHAWIQLLVYRTSFDALAVIIDECSSLKTKSSVFAAAVSRELVD